MKLGDFGAKFKEKYSRKQPETVQASDQAEAADNHTQTQIAPAEENSVDMAQEQQTIEGRSKKGRSGKNGKSKKLVFGIVAAVVAIAAGGSGAAYYMYQKDLEEMNRVLALETIYPGVSINKVDVSSLTKAQASELLKKEFTDELDKQIIKMKYEDKEWVIQFPVTEARYHFEEAVEDAYQQGRSGEGRERYNQIKKIAADGVAIEADYSYNAEKSKEEVARVAQEFRVEAKDSVLSRENGVFQATQEESGYELDIDDAQKKVDGFLAGKAGGDFDAVAKELKPSLTKEEAMMATSLIGSFSTSYTSGAGTEGRNENLRVACLNINGTVLKPGDIFSMNVELGPQTHANGYKDAGVYVNGRVEQDVGGGVCQVTTTLYNAVIFSELEIVERHNHSLTVGYVPLGRDSAVAGDYKDLKFKNNTEYPVYVEAFLSGGKIINNIYGYEIHKPGRTLEFETVYIGSIPKPAEKITRTSTLPSGKRVVTYSGKVGHKVEVYKKVFQDGALVSRNRFNTSTYIATADEVNVGTGAVSEANTEKKTETKTALERPAPTRTPEPAPEPEPAPAPEPAPEPEPTPEPAPAPEPASAPASVPETAPVPEATPASEPAADAAA